MAVRKVSSLISDKTTAAPAWAKARAVARPMAELAPVTSATWPVKSCVGFTAVSLPWMEVVQAGAQQAAGGGRGLRSRIRRVEWSLRRWELLVLAFLYFVLEERFGPGF